VSSAHFLVSAGVYVFFPSFLKAFWAAWAAACGAVRDHARAGIEDFPRPSHRVPGALRFPKDHRPGTRTCSSSCAPKGRKGTRTIERRSLLPTMLLRSNMHDVIYLAVQVMGTIVAPPASTWRGGRNDHWLMFNRVNELTVTGRGMLDGNGQSWWTRRCKLVGDDRSGESIDDSTSYHSVLLHAFTSDPKKRKSRHERAEICTLQPTVCELKHLPIRSVT
jgi:hypothetical protein